MISLSPAPPAPVLGRFEISAAASSSLLISIHGVFEGLGVEIVGLDGITIGGGFRERARICGLAVVFSCCLAEELRLCGIRSTVSVFEPGFWGGLTTPMPMRSKRRARLIAAASAKLVARRRSGARS